LHRTDDNERCKKEKSGGSHHDSHLAMEPIALLIIRVRQDPFCFGAFEKLPYLAA
jgi:hypothetical protein